MKKEKDNLTGPEKKSQSDFNGVKKIISFAKRRGFIFQSSEIYGGTGSCWDYGPLGVELKNNVKRAWWRAMVYERDDIVGLDAAILMHPRVWEASGHVATFTDPMVDCKACKRRFRADDMPPSKHGEGRCPDCGGELTDARKAEFEMRREPFGLQRVARLRGVVDHVLEVLPDEVRQHEAVVQLGAPAHELLRPVGLLPEPRNEGTQQKLLR